MGRLNENGIITNMVTAIIDFNADENDSFDKLFQSEQIEIEMMNTERDETSDVHNTSQESASLDAEKATATAATTGVLKRLRRFFSCCCG